MAINSPIDSRVRIGHVHLKVANLDRALNFYCGVLGFEIISRIGDEAAFVSAGGYHHHIGLNTWESKDGSPPRTGSTGLYHLAILYPERRLLADAFRRLIAAGCRWTERPIAVSVKRSICGIPTITVSNFIGIGLRRFGRVRLQARLRSIQGA